MRGEGRWKYRENRVYVWGKNQLVERVVTQARDRVERQHFVPECLVYRVHSSTPSHSTPSFVFTPCRSFLLLPLSLSPLFYFPLLSTLSTLICSSMFLPSHNLLPLFPLSSSSSFFFMFSLALSSSYIILV